MTCIRGAHNIFHQYYSLPTPGSDDRDAHDSPDVSSYPWPDGCAHEWSLCHDKRSPRTPTLHSLRSYKAALHIIFQIRGIVSQISHFLKYPSSPLSYRSIDPSHAAHITLPPLIFFNILTILNHTGSVKARKISIKNIYIVLIQHNIDIFSLNSTNLILSILVYTFFSRMFDLCCLL